MHNPEPRHRWVGGMNPVLEVIEEAEVAVVKSDDYSGHSLPIGAHVQRVPTPDWADGTDWYSQGGDGDEVAVDLRDLEPPATC